MIKPPAQKGEYKRVRFNCRIASSTLDKIRHWAKVKDRSQSEIVDEAIGLFSEVEEALQVAEDNNIISIKEQSNDH